MEEIIENLEVLLASVEAQPETNLNLSTYRQESNKCGTLYCVAGLAATLPHFNAKGVRYDDEGEIRIGSNGGHIGHDHCTNPLFGYDSWYNLFAPYGSGNNDEKLGAYKDGTDVRTMTDKELSIARLKLQIATVKGEEQ